MKGDRVAVLGRGIAVVEHADDTEVHALLGNRIIVRMRRNDVAWNQQNLRWEAEASAPLKGASLPQSGKGRFADDALKMCPASSHQFCASSRCTAPRSTFAPLTISCGRENSSGA